MAVNDNEHAAKKTLIANVAVELMVSMAGNEGLPVRSIALADIAFGQATRLYDLIKEVPEDTPEPAAAPAATHEVPRTPH